MATSLSKNQLDYQKKQAERIKTQLKDDKSLTDQQKKALERELSGIQVVIGEKKPSEVVKVTPTKKSLEGMTPQERKVIEENPDITYTITPSGSLIFHSKNMELNVGSSGEVVSVGIKRPVEHRTEEQKYVVTDYGKQQSYMATESEVKKMKENNVAKASMLPVVSNSVNKQDLESEKYKYKASKEVWPFSSWWEENVVQKIGSKDSNLGTKTVRAVARVPEAVGIIEPVFTAKKWFPKLVENVKFMKKKYGTKYASEVLVLGTVMTATEPIAKDPYSFFVTGLATEFVFSGVSRVGKSATRRYLTPEQVSKFKVVEDTTITKRLIDLEAIENTNIDTVHATLSKDIVPTKKNPTVLLEEFPSQAKGLRKEYEIFPFYKSIPSEDKAVIYGGYIGLGKGESGLMKSKVVLFKSGKYAILEKGSYVTKTPRLSLKNIVDWQNLPEQTGKTFLAPEDVFRMSNKNALAEGQVVTPASSMERSRLGSYIELVEDTDIGGKYLKYTQYKTPPELVGKLKFTNDIWDMITKKEHEIKIIEVKTRPVSWSADSVFEEILGDDVRKINLGKISESYGINEIPLISRESLSVGSASFMKSLGLTLPKTKSSRNIKSQSFGFSLSKIISPYSSQQGNFSISEIVDEGYTSSNLEDIVDIFRVESTKKSSSSIPPPSPTPSYGDLFDGDWFFNLDFDSLGGGRANRNEYLIPKNLLKTVYEPSLEAVTFDIKMGKNFKLASGLKDIKLTGLEVRPILD